jgi:hypothetical protein
MTGISLRMRWPLTSKLHGSVTQNEQLFFFIPIKLPTPSRQDFAAVQARDGLRPDEEPDVDRHAPAQPRPGPVAQDLQFHAQVRFLFAGVLHKIDILPKLFDGGIKQSFLPKYTFSRFEKGSGNFQLLPQDKAHFD